MTNSQKILHFNRNPVLASTNHPNRNIYSIYINNFFVNHFKFIIVHHCISLHLCHTYKSLIFKQFKGFCYVGNVVFIQYDNVYS